MLWHAGWTLEKTICMNMTYNYSTTIFRSILTQILCISGIIYNFPIWPWKIHKQKLKIYIFLLEICTFWAKILLNIVVSLIKKQFLFIQENFHASKSFWKIYPLKVWYQRQVMASRSWHNAYKKITIAYLPGRQFTWNTNIIFLCQNDKRSVIVCLCS